MDRDRLKQVQQTDLTESKVNEDFVDWLKNKGPTYLLIALVALVATLGWFRIQEGRQQGVNNAFYDLDAAIQPDSLDSVAAEHAGIGSVSELARLRAGEHYLRRLQRRNNPDEPLTPASDEQLDDFRTRATGYFQSVVDATREDSARALLFINALYGLAAIEESRGDLEAAETLYHEIAAASKTRYPVHAAQAESRIAGLVELFATPPLPDRASLPAPPFIDPLLKDILGENGIDL